VGVVPLLLAVIHEALTKKGAPIRTPLFSEPQGTAVSDTFRPKFIKNIQINCDNVTRFGTQQDQRFIMLYWDMQDRFGDKNYGRQVCLHEAAHAVLMEQDGIKNVKFAGPDISYDPSTNRFIAISARAIGDDMPNAIVNDDFIFMIVCHTAAGGAALRSAGIPETGDDEDFQDFSRKYAANPPQSGENHMTLWKRAQEAVVARLNDPETRQKVQAKAAEYFRLLYPSE
jgi:hypothetical protein